ncbi:MAG: tRNA pseudouridine(55) synthase TruB, partial [Gemmatimonadaceae bacterium]
KQVGGQRAHAAARRGAPLALAAVHVTVHEWTVRAWRDDEVDVTIACSGGTYVRALARDLGRDTGSAAHLTQLRRLRSGPFDVAASASANDLRAGAALVQPPVAAVPSMPVLRLDPAAVRHVRQGRDVAADPGAGTHAALVDESNALVAIAQRDGAWWHPRTVLADD